MMLHLQYILPFLNNGLTDSLVGGTCYRVVRKTKNRQCGWLAKEMSEWFATTESYRTKLG